MFPLHCVWGMSTTRIWSCWLRIMPGFSRVKLSTSCGTNGRKPDILSWLMVRMTFRWHRLFLII
jgi:hypothetical protein